jgi:hypothetical protein
MRHRTERYQDAAERTLKDIALASLAHQFQKYVSARLIF